MPRLPLAVLLTISQLSCGDFLRPDRMYRKVIGNKDALCNDGSSAVYYIGVRDPARWVIFLESGSYCLTREQCEERFGSKDTNILMTSRGMPEVTIGRDLLSVNSQENKLFHSYSGILIPYCSSDSWMGTQTKSQLPDLRLGLSAKKFIFSGKIIFQSVIYEFLGQFSKEVREIVFAGSSAGAVAVLNHMQWFQSLLSSKNISTKLSAIVDGGWFINFRESIMSKLTSEFFNISKPMSRACADFSNGYPCCLSAPCMLAQGYYPDNVPTFFVSSMFDIYIIGDVVLQQLEDRTTFVESGGGDIITLLDLYGGAMNQSLTVVRSPNVSFFVPACFQHTFFSMSGLRDKGGVLHYDKMFSQGNAVFSTSKEHRRWLSLAIRQGKRIVTLQSALFKWAQTHQPVKMIENCLGALCNPTCPEKLMFVDTAVQWSEDLVTLLGLVSLVPTVLCVALRTTFYIQSLLVSRAQKESLRGSKSPEDKIWIPVEPVRLHYSTPDRFQHYYSEVRRQKTGRYTNAEENKMTHDYTSKGCNIFYSTAEYVRAAIGARNKVYPANDTARRFYSEDSDVYSGDWRTTNASNVELGVGRPLNYQDVRDERLNMADAVCKKGVDNADLTFKDGEMIAVLGKSGAGKTTLLHLLCGEFACGCGQGHLTVNGVKQEKLPSRVRNLGNVARLSWFARLGDLTVREHLTLSALMTTAGNMCNIVERVEQIIRETRLNTVADQAVNGTDKIHLTELQKRLFGVALQLATRPLVILLDDPITGLNHESTLDLLDIIRRISDRGHLVVATMESIPKEAAQRFDQIVLLDDKQIVYSGSPTTLAQRYNQLTRDSPDKEKMPLEGVIGDILQDKKVMLLMVDEQSRNKVREKVATHPSRKEKNSPQTREMGGLLARLFVIDYRASLPRSLGESLFLPVVFTMIGITAGIVYWQTDTPLRILTAYSGSSIPSLLFLCSFVFNRVTRCLETCRQGPAEIVGYSHEHVTQTFTSLTAECVLPVLICATLTYFMVMPSYNLQRFVLVTNISLVLNQTWIAVYMLITFANPSNACHAGFMVAALAGFSAGFVVTRLEMPFGYNFLFYVNPQYYGYSAISKALLKDTRLYCDYESFFNCISQDGNAVLAKFAFDSVNPHQHMMIMLGITLLCLLFSWLLCDARSSR